MRGFTSEQAKRQWQDPDYRQKMSLIRKTSPIFRQKLKELNERQRQKMATALANRLCQDCNRKSSQVVKKGNRTFPRWYHIKNDGRVEGYLCPKCYYQLKNANKPRQKTGRKAGFHHSEEWKKELSQRFSGEQNPFYGKKHKPDTIQLIVNANVGRKFKMPPEHSERMRERRLTQVFPKIDTKLERRLQDGLRAQNIQFETHKTIYGQPDIFIEPNICIFADGNYWHANPTHYPEDQIISKQHKWTAREVRERDKQKTITLELMGYKVLRFWEDDINKRLDWCISEILKVVPKPVVL